MMIICSCCSQVANKSRVAGLNVAILNCEIYSITSQSVLFQSRSTSEWGVASLRLLNYTWMYYDDNDYNYWCNTCNKCFHLYFHCCQLLLPLAADSCIITIQLCDVTNHASKSDFQWNQKRNYKTAVQCQLANVGILTNPVTVIILGYWHEH